ncbi:MAG: hypothetical protein A2044_04805 [Candidatus Firestonebacteria bacterium GWA2_43_8]|nr:MAG: hypothetical protein A2044_04805 [Candidatus Firestonebacteria bacterium GWA2_43_8]
MINGTRKDEGKMKIIETSKEYEKVMKDIEILASVDPCKSKEDGEKLDLLILLAKDYESRNFEKVLPPDPVEAIKFRMDQQNLSQRDLIPYIGSRSKVSEILSGKRSLTIDMIRSLHDNLGIPLESLIQEPKANKESLVLKNVQWEKFNIKEIIRRKWVECQISDKAEDIIREFLKPLGSMDILPSLNRRSKSIRSARTFNEYSLMLWNARIQILAKKETVEYKYKKGTVTPEFISEIIHLSPESNGPLLAKKKLEENGIRLVTEPHLPETHLDGAAIPAKEGPIIGLTLRFNRLDNFWFCLAHELAHISLHLDGDKEVFFDDLEQKANNALENEADALANDSIFPSDIWNEIKKNISLCRNTQFIRHYSDELKIHPAILAGKIQYETRNYRLFGKLVNQFKVRQYFEN